MIRRRLARLMPLAHSLRRLWWKAWGPITVGARAIVVDDHGKVLLVRHTYDRSVLHIPGGGVHRREPLADAVRRELREELGIVVPADAELELLGAYSNLREGKSDHIVVVVVRDWHPADGTGPSGDELEVAEICRADPDDLPADASPGTRRRIDEWRGRRPPSLEW